MRKILFLCFAFFAVPQTAKSVEVYFTPSLACEDRIVKAIDSSKNSINGVVQNITSPRIFAALKRAKKRGVQVSLLTDARYASSKQSKSLAMKKANINVRLQSKYKEENNRFATFDNKLLFTGTFNWTVASSVTSSTNCLFLNDKAAIGAHNQQFAHLWKKNPVEKSSAMFANLESMHSNRSTASKK